MERGKPSNFTTVFKAVLERLSVGLTSCARYYKLTCRGEVALFLLKSSSSYRKKALISKAGFGGLAGKAEFGAELTCSVKQGGMLERLWCNLLQSCHLKGTGGCDGHSRG